MIAAVIFFAASTGVTQATRDLDYLQMSVDIGITLPDFDFPNKMLLYTKLNTAEYMLQWACIFCVKFSYIFFFRPLTSRIRPLQIWWWIMVTIVTPAALVTICLAPWVCPYFDMTFLQKCVLNGTVIIRERVILQISTATDIATDLLVMSLPIWLLSSYKKLELRRKLALGTVLCLSIFMIIVAVIRYTLDAIPLKDGTTIPDTIWLFFWQSVEACVSIIMVSLTAFRSLYGHEKARNRSKGHNYKHMDEESSARRGAGSKTPASFLSGNGSRNRTFVDGQNEELQFINPAKPAETELKASPIGMAT